MNVVVVVLIAGRAVVVTIPRRRVSTHSGERGVWVTSRDVSLYSITCPPFYFMHARTAGYAHLGQNHNFLPSFLPQMWIARRQRTTSRGDLLAPRRSRSL